VPLFAKEAVAAVEDARRAVGVSGPPPPESPPAFVHDRRLDVGDSPRQAEPAQLQSAVLVDEHVGRLQVAVQHARLVRDAQCGDEIEREARDALFGQTLVLLQETE